MMRWILVALFVVSGAVQANSGLRFIEDSVGEGFGARGLHHQPGQLMVVFHLPASQEFIYAITNLQTNITPARIQGWVNTCETRLGVLCRMHNLVWLDNPRKVGPIE